MAPSHIFILADFTQLIVALIIIILSIVGSIIQNRQEALKREQQKRARRPRPPDDNIDVLLKEAEQKPPRTTIERPQVRPKPPGKPRTQSVGSSRTAPSTRLPEPSPGDVVTASLADNRGEETIAEHVAHTFQKGVSEEGFAHKPAGKPTTPAREMPVAYEAQPPQPPEAVPTIAEGVSTPPSAVPTEAPFHPLSQILLNTFSTPEGMATAVILRDVLERPEWRWRRQ
ncbi:hypothetical protein THTE_3762 [Thermogutta terrifontis]|uniref:Uncharacterized protein n=1 Tax=Thermogutta terrifontis TaxID=1331910 RepID=A0A286RK60_9BACT|nr:hypothetical protein [Thermogutta terrifontis]ASV76363.1 hypothetical protein THTE_3762 [Thermogutta terrifontis]